MKYSWRYETDFNVSAYSEAVREAMQDLADLDDPYTAHINLIAMDKDGRHAGGSFRAGDGSQDINASSNQAGPLSYAVVRGEQGCVVSHAHVNPRVQPQLPLERQHKL